jgi:hypothetical protein
MGLNAQTSVPTFTSSQILTAQQQNWINTGIPVFATTVTRDAAFGGAGEKTLAQGQYCYIEATSTKQVYNGTTWLSADSALQPVKATTTFTAQTTVSMPAGTFTSTYDNYVIFLNVLLQSSAVSGATSIRVNNAGTPRTAASYFGGAGGWSSSGAFSGLTTNGATSFLIGDQFTTTVQGFQINAYAPMNASYKTALGVNGFTYNTGSVAPIALSGGATYNANEAHDGLTFIFANNATGSYAVYGVVK